MEVILLKKAREDRAYWKRTGNVQVMKRITVLLNDIQTHPFTGIGKPEPLKGTAKASGRAVSPTSIA